MSDNIHTQTIATIAVAAAGGFAAGQILPFAEGAIATAFLSVASLYALAPSTETVAFTWLSKNKEKTDE